MAFCGQAIYAREARGAEAPAQAKALPKPNTKDLAEIKPRETGRTEKRRRWRSNLRRAEHRRSNDVSKKGIPQDAFFAVTRFYARERLAANAGL